MRFRMESMYRTCTYMAMAQVYHGIPPKGDFLVRKLVMFSKFGRTCTCTCELLLKAEGVKWGIFIVCSIYN